MTYALRHVGSLARKLSPLSRTMRFSTRWGSTNHVLAPEESAEHAVTVAVDALDSIAAGRTDRTDRTDRTERPGRALWLQRHRLHARLLDFGFHPTRYDPFVRRLVALEGHNPSGNTLYVRPSPTLEQRLREAPAVRVVGVAV